MIPEKIVSGINTKLMIGESQETECRMAFDLEG